MMVVCEDCRRLTSGDCGKHGTSTYTVPRAAGTLEFRINLDPVPLRCSFSGNPCGTDTHMVGHLCACVACRQWTAAFKDGLRAALIIANQHKQQHAKLADDAEQFRRWDIFVSEQTAIDAVEQLADEIERTGR